MALAVGTRLGSYEIVGLLGKGGMGEVYRARDHRLQRDVALKVLPSEWTTDAASLARLEREAKLLASLNHANIATIHGVEDSEHVFALVLEVVDGETLAERIARGPLSAADALRIAHQLADALAVAHAAGVIHRDLKPSNVKVRADGSIKVLDFGLAKALAPKPLAEAASNSVVETAAAVTSAGMVMGTPAYMSPEQARGLEADERSDIWAFGCVLYEMLTGKRAFAGRDATETLALVLMSEPNWTALPTNTPEAIVRLLRRALQKDSSRRLHAIADARLELDDVTTAGSGPAATARPPMWRERIAWIVAISALLGAITVAYQWRPGLPAGEMRVDIATPPSVDPVSIAISPDGRKIVFAGSVDNRTQLWLRMLDNPTAQPLAGTENARLPFWSPDGKSIGFGAEAQLKRLDLDGGAVRRLANAPVFLGGTWNADHTILFTPDANVPIFRVSDSGGDIAAVTDLGDGHLSHNFPKLLPDGNRFFYYVVGSPSQRGVYASALDAPRPRRVVDAESTGTYLPGDYVTFVRGQTGYVQALDGATLAVRGEPVALANNVAILPFATASIAALAVSAEGSILYRGGETPSFATQLAWFDRSGKLLRRIGNALPVALNPALSPDEQRLAIFRGIPPNFDIWMVDADRGSSERFTLDPGVHFAAVWSRDGRRLVISANRTGVYDLYEQAATGAGGARLLLATPHNKAATDWSPDNRYVLYRTFDVNNAFDIWALPVGGGSPFPVVQSAADERNAQFSPDGRWIAYQSNQSGRFEIWVQSFSPSGQSASARWQVSTGGGSHARWSADGRELFFVDADGRLMAVPIRTTADGQAIERGKPRDLFSIVGLRFPFEGTVLAPYAVSRDGRFLIAATSTHASTTPLTLVLNWRPPGN